MAPAEAALAARKRGQRRARRNFVGRTWPLDAARFPRRPRGRRRLTPRLARRLRQPAEAPFVRAHRTAGAWLAGRRGCGPSRPALRAQLAAAAAPRSARTIFAPFGRG